MLNKQVCMNCWETHGDGWKPSYEGYWNMYEAVYCPYTAMQLSNASSWTNPVNIKKGQKYCPYKLEQVVMEHEHVNVK